MVKRTVVYPYRGHYLEIKRNELLINSTIWKEHRRITLSEKMATPKDYVRYDSAYMALLK